MRGLPPHIRDLQGVSRTPLAEDEGYVADANGLLVPAELIVEGDARLTDARTPTDNSVSTAKLQANAVTQAKAAIGTGATQLAGGDDARFPSTGQKNALAGTAGTPGTGNEYATKQTTDARAALSHTHAEADITGGVPNELGYAQQAATAQAGIIAITDITAVSVTFTPGDRPIIVAYGCPFSKLTTRRNVVLSVRNSSNVEQTAYGAHAEVGFCTREHRKRFAAGALVGAQTFKLSIATATDALDTTPTASSPAYLHVYEV